MSENPASVRIAPRLAVRHVQLGRAVLAAIAALTITFTADHSAGMGLGTFSGFAITTALVLAFAAWAAYPAGRRWPAGSLAVFTAIAGMASGVPLWRTTELFFWVLIPWAVLTGAIELIAGLRERSRLRREGLSGTAASEARDAITVGILTLVLAVALLIVPAGYRLDYFIEDAHQWFTLTGIAIGVGIFGAYAAVIAVYLGIAAFSPRRDQNQAAPDASAPASADVPTDAQGGAA